MLIQVLFAIFLLFSMAALYADLGVARLEQIQMQNAADTAALEGLRQRDVLSEADRRSAAGGLAHFAFVEAALEPNLTDEPHGDMLAGTYDPAQDHRDEDGTYARSDFAPGMGADAFLVRMRRTANPAGLDEVAGVSSRRDPIPLVFGVASTFQQGGLPVRATAIAGLRPVKQVGPGSPGVTPYSISRTCWLSLIPVDVSSCTGSSANQVGAQVTAGGVAVDTEGYIPVYDGCPGTPGTLCIVGFGRGQIAARILTKFPGAIAPVNATALGPGPAPNLEGALLAPVLVR